MPAVPEEVRAELKQPLGELMDLGKFAAKYGKRKIIAVGDVVALALIKAGIKPFLSVYDFRTRRDALGKDGMERLEKIYPRPLLAENPSGSISGDLKKKARLALKSGGALFVQGEEDLATLVFMRLSPEGCVIVYGQPGEGVVCVECNEESRKKAEYFFAKMKS